MARGGKRAGSGRKAGSVTVRSRAIAEGALNDGLTPLDYMLGVLRDPQAPVARRDDMAKAAAPYMHAKLASVEHTGKDGGAIQADLTVRFVAPGASKPA